MQVLCHIGVHSTIIMILYAPMIYDTHSVGNWINSDNNKANSLEFVAFLHFFILKNKIGIILQTLKKNLINKKYKNMSINLEIFKLNSH